MRIKMITFLYISPVVAVGIEAGGFLQAKLLRLAAYDVGADTQLIGDVNEIVVGVELFQLLHLLLGPFIPSPHSPPFRHRHCWDRKRSNRYPWR